MNRTADTITEKIGLYTRDLHGFSLRRMRSCLHRERHPRPHHEGAATTSVPPCAEAGFEQTIARLPARIAPNFWLSDFGRSGQGPSEWSLRSDSPYLSESHFQVAFPSRLSDPPCLSESPFRAPHSLDSDDIRISLCCKAALRSLNKGEAFQNCWRKARGIARRKTKT
jgi:hypothetical protein